jgi:co-chaperonin GroES (HSP10)
MNIKHLNKDEPQADGSEPRVTVHQAVVATERLKTTQIETKTVAGMGFLDNKNSLDELTVVFDSKCLELKAGDKVYVRQNLYNAGWASQIYKLDDKEFILIPADAILATKSLKMSGKTCIRCKIKKSFNRIW